ncbi:MAG: hypothetical protein GF329_02820 [Candidatus Lokiarchaeota archaeon]|nr:hypothetical protein [Candidatus Lokiarchaeota archaeon]
MFLKNFKINLKIIVISMIFLFSLLTAINVINIAHLSLRSHNISPISKLDITLNTQTEVETLINNWSLTDSIIISPTEDIETTVTNFSMPALKDITIETSGYTINITFEDSNFTRTVIITDDTAVNFYNCQFFGNFRIGTSTSDAPSIIIINSTFEGAFLTYDYYPGRSIISNLYLEIKNSLFNQTESPWSGYMGLLSSIGSISISNTNITNGIDIESINNIELTGCIIGSDNQSSGINFQGIKVNDVFDLNIDECIIKSDSSSSDFQGIMVSDAQTIDILNSDVNDDINLDTIQAGNVVNLGIDNSIIIDSSDQLDISDFHKTLTLLDITSTDVYLSNITVNDVKIDGNQQTINLSDTIITDDLLISATSLTTINLNNVNITDKVETSIETTQTVNLNIDNCKISQDLILKGSVFTILTNSEIDDVMEVYSIQTASTTIENTDINNLIDYGNPTVTLDATQISLTYDTITEKTKTINCGWTGADNIVGTGYDISYNIKITKNGNTIYDQNTTATNYTFNADTGSEYLVYITCIDALNNTSTQKIITITMAPTYGTVILITIIVISCVAGAAVALAYYFLYYRAKRKWKKTEIISVPET